MRIRFMALAGPPNDGGGPGFALPRFAVTSVSVTTSKVLECWVILRKVVASGVVVAVWEDDVCCAVTVSPRASKESEDICHIERADVV